MDWPGLLPLAQLPGYLPRAASASAGILADEHVWELFKLIIGGLLTTGLGLAVRALNSFAKGQAKLDATVSDLKDAINALTTEVRVIEDWRLRTAEPMFSRLMHKAYNNDTGETKPPGKAD